jgi:hypothetical protein
MRFALLFLATLLVFTSVQAQYYAMNRDSAAVRVEVPAAVVASFQKVFPVVPRDTVVQWEVSGPSNDRYYAARVGLQGVAFSATGRVEESLLEVPLSALPKPV